MSVNLLLAKTEHIHPGTVQSIQFWAQNRLKKLSIAVHFCQNVVKTEQAITILTVQS